MAYVVKLRKTIVHEYEIRIAGSGEPNQMVDNVVDAMELAESVIRTDPTLERYATVKETEWAAVAVNDE